MGFDGDNTLLNSVTPKYKPYKVAVLIAMTAVIMAFLIAPQAKSIAAFPFFAPDKAPLLTA